MSDPRNTLKNKYEEASRFANFGPVITQVIIKGFRCHANTVIDVRSPVSAFCGLNGTGKSTILQLISAARRTADSDRTYYLRDFFLLGKLDPAPYRADASVFFRFWQEDRSTQQLTISKSSSGKRWNGYKRRPQGSVFFAGVGLYVPKIEQRDVVARYFSQLNVTGSSVVEQRVRDWSCKILSQAYSDMTRNNVNHAGRTAEVLTVVRDGASYSEIHMGFGEGRSQYLVSALEHMPNKSLVLIEEPETSLHPAAQYEFGRYLIDVAIEKGHQIFLTTHSEALLRALPDESRIYLHRSGTGITAIGGLSSKEALSLMTNGHDKALSVLVEDEVARAVLREIVRLIDATFLTCIHIGVGGDKDAIARTVRGLKDTGLKVAAVRDGDKDGNPNENIYKLPGTRAPEVELFESAAVSEFIQNRYAISLANFKASIGNTEHHEWFSSLADKCAVDETALVAECARVYAESLPDTERYSLVNLLKASVH
ncbi:MAG: AAA family ATPase [Thermoguttaceae bacterium]